jgi:hypothetical protein
MGKRLNMSARAQIIDLYKTGLSLREVGIMTEIPMQTVHGVILRQAPQILRAAHKGPGMTPAERLKRCAVPA